MDAKEARELTVKFHESARADALVSNEIAKAEAEIRRRANDGGGYAIVRINPIVKSKVVLSLERRGFRVKDTDNPVGATISW